MSSRAAGALASALAVSPLEIPGLFIESWQHSGSTIEARLISPSIGALFLCNVPPRVHIDRPLDVVISSIGPRLDTTSLASIARYLNVHACLSVKVENLGKSDIVPVAVRVTGDCWTARALFHPASWTDAVSVIVQSLAFAGRHVSGNFLPATAMLGYNHATAPRGAVLAAAEAGDVPALLDALDAGGSTEEASEVC